MFNVNKALIALALGLVLTACKNEGPPPKYFLQCKIDNEVTLSTEPTEDMIWRDTDSGSFGWGMGSSAGYTPRLGEFCRVYRASDK